MESSDDVFNWRRVFAGLVTRQQMVPPDAASGGRPSWRAVGVPKCVPPTAAACTHGPSSAVSSTADPCATSAACHVANPAR
eukprot:364469-Chlamydomonas_euryale.AAC.16